MQSAIILDGHLKSALAAARSLGKKDIKVYCGADRAFAMAGSSRYVKKSFRYTSPKKSQSQFLSTIKTTAEKLGDKPVVYAFSDATWLTLWEYRAQLQDICTLVWPAPDAVAIAFNKKETLQLAERLNIPITPTHFTESIDDIVGTVSFPAVVKNIQSVVWKDGAAVSGTAEFVHSNAELVDTFNKIQTQTGQAPLVQSFVQGREFGVELLAQNGEVLVEFVHERLRSLSPTGGASVFKQVAGATEEVKIMRQHARTFAKELVWNGPIMVEFKVDEKSKQPLLMEINGRFWGSLPLAVAAGVDFPWLYYQLTTGQTVATAVTIKTNTITNHFLGDVVHLLRVWFARDRMRPYLYPSRLQALKDFLLVPIRTEQDVWSFSDPLPSVVEYIGAINSFRS